MHVLCLLDINVLLSAAPLLCVELLQIVLSF